MRRFLIRGVKLALFASVLAVLLLAVAGPASAATLNVCPSGCPFSQIAPAIAAAHPGDTVRVAAGTYVGGFTVDQSFLLATSAYVVIPSLMVFCTLVMPARHRARDRKPS